MASSHPNEPPFLFKVQPAERGRSHPIAPVCAGSCCTCCCCMHTIGGLVGAVISSERPTPEVPTERSGEQNQDHEISSSTADSHVSLKNGRPSVAAVFWWTTLVLIGLGLLIGALVGMQNGESDQIFMGMVYAFFAMLMGFPAVQLLASVITLFILHLRRTEQISFEVELRQLGKIGVGWTLGSLAGFAMLFVLYLLLTSSR
jgi:hypothetical protein